MLGNKSPSMNNNAKAWVQALRSGKYEQGREWLNSDGKLCCLGVACEVYQEQVGDLRVASFPGVVTYDGSDTDLPEKVQNWLGLRISFGGFGHSSLTSENDDACKTFTELADLIESEPEGLFEA